MKKLYKTSFIAALNILLASSISAQNVPIDFETSGNGATWTWTVFENDANPVLEIVPNPYKTGINNSETVAKFTALQAGQPWAGCESLHGADIGQFTMDTENSIINIMVWKSVISDVGIKLVRSDSWSLGEIKIANTKINEWELITFDFSSHIGNSYDQIVIFPDFDLGGRSSDNIIYFDNVLGLDNISGTTVSVSEDQNETIQISPNPSSDKITLDLTYLESNTSYDIIDLSGRIITTSTLNSTHTDIDISNYSKGIYFINVKNLNHQTILKFVKE